MKEIEEVPKEIIDKRLERIREIRQLAIIASLEGSRIIIWDPNIGYELYKSLYFGKPIGIRKPKPIKYNRPYELSMYEALYLSEENLIVITKDGKTIDTNTIRGLGSKLIENFNAKYQVYRDLRKRGFIVKSGLKYGADFVTYVYGPGIDHSPFVVSVFSSKATLKGQDFLRSGRLSWSVRKRWVLACVIDSEVKYYIFEWNKDLSI